MTTEVTKLRQVEDTVDLAEIILAGVPAYCDQYHDDEATQWRTLLAVAEMLDQHELDHAADTIKQSVKASKDKVLAAGVCPHCGEDIETRTAVNHHPAPFGFGTAAERHMTYVCPTCGEV